MRVLFINTIFGKGSTGKIVKQLGDAIEAAGGEYMVAYGRGEIVDQDHSYFIGSKFDRYIHAGISRVTDRAGFYSKKCTEELVFFIRKYNPDIIHLHNLHGYYINLPVLFGYLKNEYKGKIIWTLHDCWAFTGHCTYYQYVGCSAWQTQCGNCPQKKEYPQSVLADASKRNFIEKRKLIKSISNKLTIVTVSDWLKNEVIKANLDVHSIMAIHNGVDTELFCPTESSVREKYSIGERYFFLCVSDGWDQRKGVDKVIELSKCIDDKASIVVIGMDKKQINKFPKDIICMERTWNQKELIEFYSAADVLFNPSNEETFGLVTAEAMACGTPVIVFNTTASPEIVGNEACGLIIEDNADEPNVIKNNYKRMLIEKKQKSENCRNRIIQYFSVEQMKKEYLELYYSLI